MGKLSTVALLNEEQLFEMKILLVNNFQVHKAEI